MARFMLMLRASGPPALGGPPPVFYEALVSAAKDWVKSGILEAAGGVAPAAMSVRVRLADGIIRAAGGPFPDATDSLVGYAVLEVGSQDEALSLAADVLELHRRHWPEWAGTAEVYQVFQAIECEPP